MTFQSSNHLYGFPQALTNVFPAPLISVRAPLATDFAYPIGQIWVDRVAGNGYILVKVVGNSATWNLSSTTTFEGNSGGTVTTDGAGTVKVLGVANQIQVAGNAVLNTLLLGLPAAVVAPGSLTSTTSMSAGTTVTAATGITATNGNVTLGTPGNKLQIAAGANASIGTSTPMIGGTITVFTTAVKTASKIFLTVNAAGGIRGVLALGPIVNNTSFVINSSSVGETSTVNWLIIN